LHWMPHFGISNCIREVDISQPEFAFKLQMNAGTAGKITPIGNA